MLHQFVNLSLDVFKKGILLFVFYFQISLTHPAQVPR